MSLGVRLTDGSEARVQSVTLSPADILESGKAVQVEFEDTTIAWVPPAQILAVLLPPVLK